MKAQILTVAHTKGGVGKSTLIWQLAIALNSAGVKVTIADLDFQQTATLTNAIRVSAGIAPIDVVQINDEVELMNYFDGWNEGVLLVDVGGFDSALHRLAIQGADRVLTPLKPSTTEVMGFTAFSHVLNEMDNPQIDIIFNNAHHATKNFNDVKGVISADNISFLSAVVRSRSNYDTSMGHGLGVFELNDSGSSKRAEAVRTSKTEIAELIQEVFDVTI